VIVSLSLSSTPFLSHPFSLSLQQKERLVRGQSGINWRLVGSDCAFFSFSHSHSLSPSFFPSFSPSLSLPLFLSLSLSHSPFFFPSFSLPLYLLALEMILDSLPLHNPPNKESKKRGARVGTQPRNPESTGGFRRR
jgi:hypothetical protein